MGFLPVLSYDGSSMRQLDAPAILDIATTGTSATLLAKRWESVLLVNVDDGMLNRLMKDDAAMAALMAIEGFRNLNRTWRRPQPCGTDQVRQAADVRRRLAVGDGKEGAERKSLRKQVQEKLIKFAARISVFMYLTNFREERLKDVITKLEPRRFKRVTGLTTEDFERSVSLGVFNSALTNDAVYKFRRYEDAILEYMGVRRHKGLDVGLWDTALSEEDFEATFKGLAEN